MTSLVLARPNATAASPKRTLFSFWYCRIVSICSGDRLLALLMISPMVGSSRGICAVSGNDASTPSKPDWRNFLVWSMFRVVGPTWWVGGCFQAAGSSSLQRVEDAFFGLRHPPATWAHPRGHEADHRGLEQVDQIRGAAGGAVRQFDEGGDHGGKDQTENRPEQRIDAHTRCGRAGGFCGGIQHDDVVLAVAAFQAHLALAGLDGVVNALGRSHFALDEQEFVAGFLELQQLLALLVVGHLDGLDAGLVDLVGGANAAVDAADFLPDLFLCRGDAGARFDDDRVVVAVPLERFVELGLLTGQIGAQRGQQWAGQGFR